MNAVVLEVLLVHRVGHGRSDVLAANPRRRSVIARVGRHVIAAGPLQAHERVRIPDGELSQIEAVDGAEECRVRANAERERHDDDGRPAFGLEQRAHTVAEVFEHGSRVPVAVVGSSDVPRPPRVGSEYYAVCQLRLTITSSRVRQRPSRRGRGRSAARARRTSSAIAARSGSRRRSRWRRLPGTIVGSHQEDSRTSPA
jgi:hypothetical protein